jgi:hypothetical protein
VFGSGEIGFAGSVADDGAPGSLESFGFRVYLQCG